MKNLGVLEVGLTNGASRSDMCKSRDYCVTALRDFSACVLLQTHLAKVAVEIK